MITFKPRFRGGPGSGQPGSSGPAVPASGIDSLVQGVQGGGLGALLLNASNRSIDDTLKYLSQPYSNPAYRPQIDKALMDALSLNGQDIQEALRLREGIRAGTTRAFLDQNGQVRSFTQGQPGWETAADPSWMGIGADGGDYNPFQAAATKLPSAQGRYTDDMVFDPNLGVRINRGQQAAMQPKPKASKTGGGSLARSGRPATRSTAFDIPTYRSFGR
jgi:hypothetical protein